MSTADAIETATSASELEKAAAVHDFLAAKQRRTTGSDTKYYLTSSNGSDRVELTSGLFTILKSAAAALQRGQSVTIHRRDQQITTQQAADLLGVSRPTVVKLIDDGALSATVPGTQRRKLELAEVLRYRDELHGVRSAFIAESADAFDDYSTDEIRSVLADLRKNVRSSGS